MWRGGQEAVDSSEFPAYHPAHYSHERRDMTPDITFISETRAKLREQISRVILGQEDVIDQILMLLMSGGHGLLVGVPGLAKTLLIRTVAQAMALSFQRIQFTPDLMPSDITGTDVIEENVSTGKREIRFIPGPIFAQAILADEINRTPPKTQAALLEAMQEGQVTVGGKTYALPKPFFVLATQNPIEQEGTYPLPEAQLDRFMFLIQVNYPERPEELSIILRESGEGAAAVKPVVSAEDLLSMRKAVRSVVASKHVAGYALALCRASRPKDPTAISVVKEKVSWGAGPRAALHLLLAAKARAAARGNLHVAVEDIRALAMPVLRHRILLNFIAEAEGISSDTVIQALIDSVPEIRD